jgi:hypothetical protein
MDYLQDLRDRHTIARLLPYMEMIAEGHEGMWDGINTIVDDPTGEAATYATDIDLLRAAIERIVRRQNEVAKRLIVMEERAEVETDKLIGQALGLPADRRLPRRDFDDDLN